MTENSCLWLVSVGPTGFAKTPLNRKCGGVLLDKQQDEWQKECEKEVENWEKLESSSSPKPKRKRWTANKLTIETLIALHSENTAGIGCMCLRGYGFSNGDCENSRVGKSPKYRSDTSTTLLRHHERPVLATRRNFSDTTEKSCWSPRT